MTNAEYQNAKRKAKRRAEVKAQLEANMKEYKQNQPARTKVKQAEMLIQKLGTMYYPARYLTVDDILSKTSKQKLDYYYRWCCMCKK